MTQEMVMLSDPPERATLDVPFGEMIHAMASAVAEAQARLDQSSLQVAELMSGQRILRDPEGRPIAAPGEGPTVLDSRVYFGFEVVEGERVPTRLSMMELGFTPTFYQFVDTVIEVRVALRVSRQQQLVSAGPGSASLGAATYSIRSTPIDGGYAATYSYNMEAAALFKTKIVPIPPPALLEERVRELVRPPQTSDLPPPSPRSMNPTQAQP